MNKLIINKYNWRKITFKEYSYFSLNHTHIIIWVNWIDKIIKLTKDDFIYKWNKQLFF